MKKLIHDIHNGKDIKKNFNVYRNLAVQSYAEYGTLELTFSAYTLLEEIMEEKRDLAEKEQDVIDTVLRALGEIGKETCAYGELAVTMRKLREDITAKMDLFTAYTDRLICYEYVLNRMELKYLTERELTEKLQAFDEEQYLQDLMRYLFGDKDTNIVQDKLRMVIGQVPVHMTKQKLFEKISEVLSLYQGGDRSSLDDFIYMLRTCSMVYEPKRYVGEYENIESLLKQLESADYVNMTEEKYNKMVKVLEKAAHFIHELTDFYYDLQKVVNGIYAMCLLFPYEEKENSFMRAGRSIWTCLALREYKPEMLMPLEGRIEQCLEKTAYLETVLYEIKYSYQKELEELSLTSFFEDFVLVANLLSDSLFINLEQAANTEVADADYVQQCKDKLFEELSGKMAQFSRPVRRAVMGQMIEKMPPMFQNVQEVQEYLRVNLLGCQEKAEKVIVMIMLRDLMQEELEWS